MKDTESLEEFVKNNKEKILEILKEEGDKARSKVESKKSKVAEMVKETVEVATSKEVQEHLISAGVELMMAFATLIKNMPTPEILEPVVDMVKERSETMEAAAKRSKKTEKKKSSVEKIELE